MRPRWIVPCWPDGRAPCAKPPFGRRSPESLLSAAGIPAQSRFTRRPAHYLAFVVVESGDTTTIALAGIIATAVVGIVGPAIAAWVALISRRGEIRAEREHELRAVIDAAAVRLTEAILRLDDARDHAMAAPNPMLESMHADASQLWLNEDRLGVRLGTAAPESVHYSSAVSAWMRAYTELSTASRGGGAVGADLRAVKNDRNAAFDAGQRYKDAAAARLSPEATARTRRAARRDTRGTATPGEA